MSFIQIGNEKIMSWETLPLRTQENVLREMSDFGLSYLRPALEKPSLWNKLRLSQRRDIVIVEAILQKVWRQSEDDIAQSLHH